MKTEFEKILASASKSEIPAPTPQQFASAPAAVSAVAPRGCRLSRLDPPAATVPVAAAPTPAQPITIISAGATPASQLGQVRKVCGRGVAVVVVVVVICVCLRRSSDGVDNDNIVGAKDIDWHASHPGDELEYRSKTGAESGPAQAPEHRERVAASPAPEPPPQQPVVEKDPNFTTMEELLAFKQRKDQETATRCRSHRDKEYSFSRST